MITQYRPAYYDNPRASTLSGLSTDQKPTDVENGAIYEEIDTGKAFCFDKENKAWYEMPQSGGGGSSVSVEPITITKNGVTTAPDGVAYSPITTDTYTQDGDKITITEDDGSMVVFTQGEVQEEKTVILKSNFSETTVLPDAGFNSIKQIKCQVRVSGNTDVRPITITENGIYTPTQGYAYGPVTVDVPPTSGFQLKFAISTYGAAMQNQNFQDIIYQAVFGTLEPPNGWNIPMFPLCIGVTVNSKQVYCWCSSIVDANTGVALFPGCFYVDGKQGCLEFKFYADRNDNLFFEVTRLELGGENIISQITDDSYMFVATLFPGNTQSNP